MNQATENLKNQQIVERLKKRIEEEKIIDKEISNGIGTEEHRWSRVKHDFTKELQKILGDSK